MVCTSSDSLNLTDSFITCILSFSTVTFLMMKLTSNLLPANKR